MHGEDADDDRKGSEVRWITHAFLRLYLAFPSQDGTSRSSLRMDMSK